ncbi:MAG: bifunctional diguanylate cyclase/phosphodiesterase [Acidimicrobiales bacterium]
MASPRNRYRLTTRIRLVAGVIVVAVLPLLVLAAVSMQRQREVAIEDAYTTLEGMASAQVAHLDSVVAADQELSGLLGSSDQLRAALLAHADGDPTSVAQIEALLAAAMTSSDRLVNICLHGVGETVLATVDPAATERYMGFGLDPLASDYSSLIIEGPDGSPTAVTNSPVVVDGVRIGTVTIETDASGITELATDYQGLNRTGETSIAQPTPEGAQFIAPLRFAPDAVLNVTVPNTMTNAPITLAMAGEEGRFGDTVDYRDADVLAVTRQVDVTGWGVVVKIDRAEALAGVDHFQRTVALTVAAAVFFVLIISLAIGRRVWRPIGEVTAAAVAVAGGDRSRRAQVRRSDELGDLASAVNTMTDELLEASAADTSRRIEVEELNARLTAGEQRLRHQAAHDNLTGLANRSHLRERLEAVLAGPSSSVSVLFIDLDQFKLVNDSRGHAFGDQLLIQAASRLEAAIGPDDVVARFGGDEFVVLCPDVGPTQAENLARRIHDALSEIFVVDGHSEHVACSIGIAIAAEGTTPDSIISDADVAMYRAKSSGRNRTVLFDSEMGSWVKARHEVECALREAAVSGEMDVHYQPIVDISTGEIVGLEALSRWDRPGHGPVSPQEFIAIAEDSGLIVPIGRTVFHRVCTQQVAWMNAHPDTPLRLTVNLSARELSQTDCVQAIEHMLADTGANASLITLELTETALSSDLETSVFNLHKLRQVGFSIAVDDFGTGYSSLTYLRQFPIDVVKIDRSFMTELENGGAESSIVSLVLGLGRDLGIEVVAEGIETDEQLTALRNLHCRFAQGYLFARPQPAEQVAELLWPQFDEAELTTYNMASRPADR